MTTPPPTSVLLPTTTGASVVDELAPQLREDDELLVVCDARDDPIAERSSSFPERVRLVVAGEPAGCSGKANAIHTGMEAAENDRIVWTDDDFHHPPSWLADLQAAYERHGPVSELPVFVGRDPVATLLEPFYALAVTLSTHESGVAWGGAVIFERDDLDEERFLDELGRTISDDTLLSEHLDVTVLQRTRRVPVGGTVRATLERHVRFTKIVWTHEPRTAALSAIGTLPVLAGALLYSLPVALLVTVLTAAVYARYGVRRPTFLLAYPALLAYYPLLAYALARRTFVWGGRRYRWRGKFDVIVDGDVDTVGRNG